MFTTWARDEYRRHFIRREYHVVARTYNKVSNAFSISRPKADAHAMAVIAFLGMTRHDAFPYQKWASPKSHYWLIRREGATSYISIFSPLFSFLSLLRAHDTYAQMRLRYKSKDAVLLKEILSI